MPAVVLKREGCNKLQARHLALQVCAHNWQPAPLPPCGAQPVRCYKAALNAQACVALRAAFVNATVSANGIRPMCKPSKPPGFLTIGALLGHCALRSPLREQRRCRSCSRCCHNHCPCHPGRVATLGKEPCSPLGAPALMLRLPSFSHSRHLRGSLAS